MSEIKAGDVVVIRSDSDRKVVMTVEGLSRGRDQCGRSSNLQHTSRNTDVSCVWVDASGNIIHDDFAIEALVIHKAL